MAFCSSWTVIICSGPELCFTKGSVSADGTDIACRCASCRLLILRFNVLYLKELKMMLSGAHLRFNGFQNIAVSVRVAQEQTHCFNHIIAIMVIRNIEAYVVMMMQSSKFSPSENQLYNKNYISHRIHLQCMPAFIFHSFTTHSYRFTC